MAVILIIDDDDGTRETARMLLTRAGHAVYLAADGLEGAKMFRELRPIDLTVTDLMMPLVEGVETIRAIREIEPGARVLLISGSGPAEELRSLARDLSVATLPKPFRQAQLLDAVNQCLAG